MLQQARAQLAESAAAMGPLTLVRAAEEHGGPHSAWFWDPDAPGRRRALRHGLPQHRGRPVPAHAGRAPAALPRAADASRPHVGLLKWGQPRWRDELLERHGVDYARTPAEDFATGLVTYRNPETGQQTLAQFTVSWMYDKQGLRLLVDGIGPGYALEANSLRSPLEVFIGDAAARRRSPTPSSRSRRRPRRAGLLAIQPNEPDLYGYTDENVDALAAFRDGRSRAPRLRRRLRGRAPHDGRVPVGRAGPRRRPHRSRRRAPALDDYVPLIQQGRGAEVLSVS